MNTDFDFDCKINWESFEQIVGHQATLFREHCDSFLVFLKMMNKTLEFNELCIMLEDDFLFDYFFSEDNIEFISLCNDNINDLHKEFNQCMDCFTEKTNIKIYFDTSLLPNDFSIKGYFCLDVLEPTINGFVYKDGTEEKLNWLKNQGIDFQITKDLVV